MRMTEKPRKTFTAFAHVGAFARIVATLNQDSGRWALFGVAGNDAVFVQKARGGVREWSSLDRLAEFCRSSGIARFEVHDATVNARLLQSD